MNISAQFCHRFVILICHNVTEGQQIVGTVEDWRNRCACYEDYEEPFPCVFL